MTQHLSRFLEAYASKIRHLTLTATNGANGRAAFQASALLTDSGGYRIAYHDDPSIALAVVLMVKRTGQPFEPGVLYWHHPESGSIFKTWPTDPDPRDGSDGSLVEQIDPDRYFQLSIEYGVIDTPLQPTPAMIEVVATEDDFADLL